MAQAPRAQRLCPRHPTPSPATLNPQDRLHDLVQDALRGSAMQRVPCFDQAQVAADQILMVLLSACVLGGAVRDGAVTVGISWKSAKLLWGEDSRNCGGAQPAPDH